MTPATFAAAPSAAIVAKAACISARDMKDADFPQRFEARLHVGFADGTASETYVDDVFGGARRAPSREAVLTKFRANAGLLGTAADVEALTATVLSIEHSPVQRDVAGAAPISIHRSRARRRVTRTRRMSFDLIIRGGTVVLPETDGVAADIAISNGRIAAILAPGTAVEARETLDASGKTILPGVIDVHLHLGHGKDIARPRVPEDAATETAAAAMGGVTTFIPYLMATDPFETLFDEVKEVTEAGARIDFGYHFIISTEEQLAGVPRYAREFGAPSFKIFMNNRGGEGDAARSAGYRRRLSVPPLRSSRREWRHGLPAPGEHRGRVGSAQARDGRRPGRTRRPARLECDASAVRRGRCRAARRPVRARDRRAGSTSCTPRRRRRSRPRCAPATPAPTSPSKPARTT